MEKKSLLLISFLFAPISTTIFLNYSHKDISKNINDIVKQFGPVFIKFGQTLSTRPDLIGIDIADNLKLLQDKLTPFSGKIAKKIIEDELGTNIEEIFETFNEEPVASASVAQVHKAKLKNGIDVAVKILRPNIDKKYKSDIALLYSLSKFLCLFSGKNKRLKPIEVVDVFKKTMVNELNLMREASACSELKDYQSKDENVILPEIYWDYTTERIFTLSWIENGISIYDQDKIKELGFDNKELAKKLAVMFFNQAYRDGFFHADLHPGNILVTNEGNISLLDFGIMGRLPEKDRIAIAEILHAFLNKNYKRVAEIHVRVGYVPKDCDIPSFALACRAVAEPILHKPTSEISIGKLLNRLFSITEEFGMQTQPQLLLLQKTMVVVEGIGKQLDSNVNMWELAEPWIKKWAVKNISLDAKIFAIIKRLIAKIENELEL